MITGKGTNQDTFISREFFYQFKLKTDKFNLYFPSFKYYKVIFRPKWIRSASVLLLLFKEQISHALGPAGLRLQNL